MAARLTASSRTAWLPRHDGLKVRADRFHVRMIRHAVAGLDPGTGPYRLAANGERIRTNAFPESARLD